MATPPNLNSGGNRLSVQGTNFADVTSVMIGGVSALYSVVSPTIIMAIAPVGVTGLVDVIVTIANGALPPTVADQIDLGGFAIEPAR